MKRQIVSFTALLVAAVVSALSGCGPNRPATATVSGRITYQGKPVAEGRIVFHPQDGRRPAMAAIESDGSYRLTTFDSKDGALPGKHRVTIKAVRVVGGVTADRLCPEAGTPAPAAAQPITQWLVPEKYSNQETTPLTADVAAGENTINFDI